MAAVMALSMAVLIFVLTQPCVARVVVLDDHAFVLVQETKAAWYPILVTRQNEALVPLAVGAWHSV